jgi:hypothetical protein
VGKREESFQEEDEEEEEDMSCVHSSRQLLKPDDIAASLMHHTAVLLTFGTTNPVLAVAVTCTICLQTLQWVMLMNRFVFKRLLLGGMWGAADVLPPPAPVSPSAGNAASVQRDELVGDIIASIERERRDGESGVAGKPKRSTQPHEELDQCLSLVETSVQNFEALLSLCIFPVVSVSCVFFVFFSWDIAADRLGFVQSMWVPLIAVAIPFLLVLYVKRYVLAMEKAEI